MVQLQISLHFSFRYDCRKSLLILPYFEVLSPFKTLQVGITVYMNVVHE